MPTNPLFSGWLEALGIPPQNIVYSDFTSEEMYKEGAKRGAIDPCFPSKIGIPHVHNLLYKHHTKRPLDVHLLPDDRHAQPRTCPARRAAAPARP